MARKKIAAGATRKSAENAAHGALLAPGYSELLESIKKRIGETRVRAAISANRELIRLYWDIGREIVQRKSATAGGRML